MLITKANYPRLLEACQYIAYDNGRGDLESVSLTEYEEDLECAEAALRELSDDDFESFCISGDRQLFIDAATHLYVADKILEIYLESFS